ncbi:MAG: TonB-dependent receptor [Gammaproteobacteria bacterium]|nr:TonB-dependent receptor [Gammaproteobacteria bacterium]
MSNYLRLASSRVSQVFLLCFLGTTAMETFAQGALEEIVVTARKREESLQDTPVSVAAFTNADLEARGTVDFSDLGEFTPNVTFDYTSAIAAGNSAAIVMIRGVGAADWTIGTDPGVGIYLDGIYISRTIGSVMDTVDVERIEVLRGPQGTLFGRNTIGGAISVVTKKPDTEAFAGRAELTFGSYDRIDGNAYINLPINDTMAASASFSKRTRDGYVENLFPGAPDLGDNDDTTTRVAFRWQPSDSLTVDLSADYSTTDEAPAANVLIATNPGQGFYNFTNALTGGGAACLGPNNTVPAAALTNPGCYNDQWAVGPFQTFSSHVSSTPELQNDDAFGLTVKPESGINVWGIGGTIEWDVSDNVTLKSITAHRRVEDGFWSRDSSHSGNQGHVLARTSNAFEQSQTSQEFQILASALDDRLNFIIGTFYMEEKAFHKDVVELVLNTVFDSGGITDNSSSAIFAQGTYDITDQLALTLGIRYTDEDKEFSARSTTGLDNANPETPDPVTGLPASLLNGAIDCLGNVIGTPGQPACLLPLDPVTSNANELEPYVNVSYQWNDDLMTYVSYSEGFKGGAFTQRVFPPALATPTSNPEFVKVYEGGFKSTWLDNRLRMNGAVFFTDYTDLQINVSAGTGTGAIGDVTKNAAAAEILGFELEMTAVPVDEALIQLGIGYLDAEYTEIDTANNPFGGIVISQDSKLVNAPKWNIVAAAQYDYNLGDWGTLTPRVDVSHTSAVYNSPENDLRLRQGANTLLNLSMTWRDVNDVWSVTAAGKNVTDETYLVTGVSGSGIVEGVYGLPATWSLSIRRNFD